MKLVDTPDLKSVGRKAVPVRFRPGALLFAGPLKAEKATASSRTIGSFPCQIIASKPLSAMMLSSLRAGPVGCVSPCSHFRTVEAEVFR